MQKQGKERTQIADRCSQRHAEHSLFKYVNIHKIECKINARHNDRGYKGAVSVTVKLHHRIQHRNAHNKGQTDHQSGEIPLYMLCKVCGLSRRSQKHHDPVKAKDTHNSNKHRNDLHGQEAHCKYPVCLVCLSFSHIFGSKCLAAC